MGPSPRVDPRIERTREAVVAAVASLLASEGPEAITHQRVARQCGVGRTTLYRHWPHPEDLLYEALENVESTMFVPARDEPFDQWLRRSLRHAARLLAQSPVIQLTAVLISRSDLDESGREMRDRLVARNVAALDTAIERALRRGDRTECPAADELFTALIGPVFLRVLFEGREASPAFIDDVVTRALRPA